MTGSGNNLTAFLRRLAQVHQKPLLPHVTRSRKRNLNPQKFKIALLLPAHCAFYWESNGTKMAGIRASVVDMAASLRLLSCDCSPRLSEWMCSSLVFGSVWRHGGALSSCKSKLAVQWFMSANKHVATFIMFC